LAIPGSGHLETYLVSCEPMTVIDELVRAANAHAERFDREALDRSPRRGVAIVACMDARVDPWRLFGLSYGDAHVIRNAGGVITDAELRALAISQRLMGTREILLLRHTHCGMLGFSDESFADELEHATGSRPAWTGQALSDLDQDTRESIARVRSSPFLLHKQSVRGFIYDVDSGKLREVQAAPTGAGA
jgi:carbonic anhydrase